ncbi:flagellar basal body rod protein FlgB [bacterium]|nr:flagellar basal body rod protein FlgB [bacterium]
MADNIIQNQFINGVTSTAALKKGLDAWAMRQRAHAQNIANAETPGYRRVVVDFEAKLKEALGGGSSGGIARTDPQHMQMSDPDISQLNPELRREPLDPNGSGINGVDIDVEMAEMAETQLRYLTATELLKRRYDGLKSVIRGSSQ